MKTKIFCCVFCLLLISTTVLSQNAKFVFGKYMGDSYSSVVFNIDSSFIFINNSDSICGTFSVNGKTIVCKNKETTVLFRYMNMDSIWLVKENDSAMFNKIVGYYPNGVTHYCQSTYFYLNDTAFVRSGIKIIFDCFGERRKKVHYKDGRLSGRTKSYFKGKCDGTGRYRNGEKIGIWKSNSIFGKCIYFYKNGVLKKSFCKKYSHPKNELIEEYMEPYDEKL